MIRFCINITFNSNKMNPSAISSLKKRNAKNMSRFCVINILTKKRTHAI